MEISDRLTKEKSIVVESSKLSSLNKERLFELVCDSVNWERVFEYAMRNKVLYIMFHNLQNCELDKYIPNSLKK